MDDFAIMWVVGGVIASLMLFKMMRRRQSQLARVLREYIESQLEWARKRAKAARIAANAAREKASQEQKLASLTATDLGIPDEDLGDAAFTSFIDVDQEFVEM